MQMIFGGRVDMSHKRHRRKGKLVPLTCVQRLTYIDSSNFNCLLRYLRWRWEMEYPLVYVEGPISLVDEDARYDSPLFTP